MNKNPQNPPRYNQLTFRDLRTVNTRRNSESFKQCASWTLADWGNAMAGETGEACNVIKKIRRGDHPLESMRGKLASELADVVLYCDLLASEAGIDLGEACARKFNEVSQRVGSKLSLNVLENDPNGQG